ncbi:hypothetical protein [Streptacidiphilus sp. MAP12-33]|uniref:hypothetical protein n=1 Tax=Streptacidiphilus sp. MAP12-33 TaxID=3156266 RepID=UPI0035121CC1
MDWATLLSAGVGAGIGITSTLLTDKVRWRRDHLDRRRESNRQLYAEYLAALWRTLDDIRDASRNVGLTGDERGRIARDAFKNGGAYALRYQVSVVAGDGVERASAAALRTLRDLRDLVESGITFGEPPYRELRRSFDERYAELRLEMRTEAGLP